MALSPEQQARYIFKKIHGRADTSPYLELHEEAFTSGFIVEPKNFWIDADKIPDTAPILANKENYYVASSPLYPETTYPVLQRFIDSPLQFIEGTVATFKSEELQSAIPHDYKDGSYHFVLKDGSNREIPFGLNNWFVDTQAGILTFYTGMPEGLVLPLKISFYKYVGRTSFDDVIKTDGSTTMDSRYYPTNDSDVATKQYTDDVASEIWDVVDKLTPDRPNDLKGQILSMDLYTARKQGTGAIHQCSLTKTPSIYMPKPFYDGDKGTLTAYMDGAAIGEAILTKADDSGRYGSLVITADEDPYKGENQRKNFFKQITAHMETEEELLPGLHSAKMIHSITGATVTKLFYIDNPSTPSVHTFETSRVTSNIRYISGVPSVTTNDSIRVSFKVDNAVNEYYPVEVGKILSSHVESKDCKAETILNKGETVSIAEEVKFLPNTYGEKTTISVIGFNSRKDPSETITQEFPIRVDTVSIENNRLSSGTGLYPSAYGSVYDSSQDLHTNEELQLVNGRYQWPKGDYRDNTPVAGPNYDDIQGAGTIRWALFKVGELDNAGGFNITFHNASNFIGSPETNITQGLKLYAKLVNDDESTGWIDCNNYYMGVGCPKENGDNGMVISSSTATIKRVTFGPTVRSGMLYLRVGLPSLSPNAFSTVTVEQY